MENEKLPQLLVEKINMLCLQQTELIDRNLRKGRYVFRCVYRDKKAIMKWNEFDNGFCERLQFYSLSGKIALNETSYRVKNEGYVYSVDGLFDGRETVECRVFPRKRGLAHRIITRLFKIGHNNPYDGFVDSFCNYSGLWYLMAVVMLNNGIGYLHGGIVENGTALAITGTGGCGKTSVMLEILKNREYRYLAEDFAGIAKDGTVYSTVKKAAIYGSDCRYGNRMINGVIDAMPLWDRIRFRLFWKLGRNPRTRLSPTEIFGAERCGNRADLRLLLFMERTGLAEIELAPIDNEDLKNKICHAAFRELKELAELLNNILAVGDCSIREKYPALEELKSKYKDILEDALSDQVLRFEIKVPLKASPSQIIESISDYL